MSVLIQPIHQTIRTSNTFVMPNDLTEHDVLEIINTTNKIQTLNFTADISLITRNNFKLKIYFKIDGTNYQLKDTLTFSATDNVAKFEENYTSYSIKITALNNILEGATRDIPYIYYVEPN